MAQAARYQRAIKGALQELEAVENKATQEKAELKAVKRKATQEKAKLKGPGHTPKVTGGGARGSTGEG
eukprot:1155430-Pelagomonas_calceolata.AAC.3